MKLYRFLTGPDDSSFCHRLSKALSNGWQLYGSPTHTYDHEKKCFIAGQAVIKDVPDEKYSPDIKLSDF